MEILEKSELENLERSDILPPTPQLCNISLTVVSTH